MVRSKSLKRKAIRAAARRRPAPVPKLLPALDSLVDDNQAYLKQLGLEGEAAQQFVMAMQGLIETILNKKYGLEDYHEENATNPPHTTH